MATRKPKKVEIGLRIDDMVILREAGRIARGVLVQQLRGLKDDMERKIRTAERLDATLDRLDVAIAKAEAAYGLDVSGQQEASRG